MIWVPNKNTPLNGLNNKLIIASTITSCWASALLRICGRLLEINTIGVLEIGFWFVWLSPTEFWKQVCMHERELGFGSFFFMFCFVVELFEHPLLGHQRSLSWCKLFLWKRNVRRDYWPCPIRSPWLVSWLGNCMQICITKDYSSVLFDSIREWQTHNYLKPNHLELKLKLNWTEPWNH